MEASDNDVLMLQKLRKKFSVGDTIIGTVMQNLDIEREITAVRETGYSWKYADSDIEYKSENSSDPLFERGWILSERLTFSARELESISRWYLSLNSASQEEKELFAKIQRLKENAKE